MRIKILSFAGIFVFALLALTAPQVSAQESEVTVVDEVIAQVNDDVITLSVLKRESKERVDALRQDGKMTEQQAIEEVNKRQAELIATLINERLLLQKGKELDLAGEIETEVNRRMLEIAREQGINSILKLEEAMRANGLVPEQIKETMRSEMMKQAVLQQEVDRRVYLGFRTDEVKAYFEAHKDQFRKPESINISEIWLSTVEKDPEAVRARVTELVQQIRAGADFKALAAANSERTKDGQRTAPKDFGVVGNFEMPSLREDLAAKLKTIKVGDITDPIQTPDGFQIIRVNERFPPGTTPTFNDNQVRQAMLAEKSQKAREEYLTKLRSEAFIKVAEAYKDSVEPLLKVNTTAAAKSADKDKKKKN